MGPATLAGSGGGEGPLILLLRQMRRQKARILQETLFSRGSWGKKASLFELGTRKYARGMVRL